VLDKQWDGAILHALERAGAATVFVERREDLSVLAASADYPNVSYSVWAGGCVERPGRSLFFHSDLLPEQLEELVAGNPLRDATRTASDLLEIDPDPALATVTEAIVEAQKRFPEAGFQARWVEFDQRVKIGHKGAVFDDRRSSQRFRMDAVLQRGQQTSSAAAERVPCKDNNYISSLLTEVIERLEIRLDAVSPDPGPTAVVFAPGIAGIWIHELVGHAAEADVTASWLTPETIGVHPGLTVIDDPRRGRAAWTVDDEGTPARPVALIHAGRPNELLHSRRTASHSGSRTTGHGRRGSYREPVLPRMGCTFIANGTDDPNEILQNVQQGVFVRRMESAHTNPRTGHARFRVTDADRIDGGKLAAPLKPFLLETVAAKALAAIEHIGNDLTFDRCIGSCHRQGQPLTTSVGAPTICTGLMTVRV